MGIAGSLIKQIALMNAVDSMCRSGLFTCQIGPMGRATVELAVLRVGVLVVFGFVYLLMCAFFFYGALQSNEGEPPLALLCWTQSRVRPRARHPGQLFCLRQDIYIRVTCVERRIQSDATPTAMLEGRREHSGRRTTQWPSSSKDSFAKIRRVATAASGPALATAPPGLRP